LRSDLNDSLWQQAGRYKVTLPNSPPIADCFCLALAVQENAELVTGDHSDFDDIAKLAIAKIRFVR